ncbi:MAG: hypothetical protein A7315_10960 [Candidatus Altiarchaeales archaeon WOR_SM1_79]|nr:MAG: hypothetical protein A7315_10960 [Candidatus Altiarchaeales archaeon WOR_SM1_79]
MKTKKVKIREKHTLDSLKFIIKEKPDVLVLESANPKFNNKTINLAKNLMDMDWEKANTKFITKFVYNQRKGNKHAINSISIMLKHKNSDLQINQFNRPMTRFKGREA